MSEGQQPIASERKGPGLAARFVLAFCGLFLVFGSGVVFTVWNNDRQNADRHATDVLRREARSIAAQMDIAERDSQQIDTAYSLELVVSDPAAEPRGLRIVAADRVLADHGAPAFRKAIGEFVRGAGAGGEILVAAAPMKGGQVYVAAERRVLRHGSMGTAAFVASLFFGFGALAALIAWFMARSISDPLSRLTAFAETFGETFSAAPVEFKTGDELETLGRAVPNHERFTRDVTEFLNTRQGETGGLFVVRLDRLDRIFDAVGHDAGDELLARIVNRFASAVRAIDRMVRTEHCVTLPSQLARLRGGDFAILASSFRGPEDAARFAQLLASALNQPFDWREHKLVLGAAIGAAILPQDADDADTAIRHAMLALSAARADNGRMKFFTKALDREAHAQLAFEREMRAALERNEFKAYFQPKVDLLSGRVIGAEALARWVKPDRTMVSPGRFIPAAEENGLIGSISEVILRDACWKAADWAREGFPLSVAVNISPLQFADERFTDKILRAMADAGLSPDRMELEITESVALENPERALRLLEPLRSLGVKVSLDDFGCGHSSLASLTRLPFDIIKIDQQFVRALAKDRHAPAIIEMILAMAASLDYTVVAEGIETEQEADFLRRRGCQIGQGFLWGAAMPAPEFLRFNAERANVAQRGVA
ncbi:MAG: diguanylate cyclase/phosphodiesterase [Alphaproteobacteria bacterium]|nr:MAG: diguanylate cyclase/phosphodiesterase [Alphaproteobacteria bacterium]